MRAAPRKVGGPGGDRRDTPWFEVSRSRVSRASAGARGVSLPLRPRRPSPPWVRTPPRGARGGRRLPRGRPRTHRGPAPGADSPLPPGRRRGRRQPVPSPPVVSSCPSDGIFVRQSRARLLRGGRPESARETRSREAALVFVLPPALRGPRPDRERRIPSPAPSFPSAGVPGRYRKRQSRRFSSSQQPDNCVIGRRGVDPPRQ
jgi:hypothetical protein